MVYDIIDVIKEKIPDMKKDITFIIIGLFITIIIPFITFLFYPELSISDILTASGAICILDILCGFAHRAANRTV